MPRAPRLDAPGTFTHVIARGNERHPVFRDDPDRVRYLEILEEGCARSRARVLAFCLMPNHVHLLLQTGPVPVSGVVHALHSRYAHYFNRRYDRAGHLFQGRFQGVVVDRERYLLEVVRYIHRNPVKARLVRQPEEFPWSSHRLYLGAAPRWLATGEVLDLLAGTRPKARRLFQEFVAGTANGDYDPDGASLGAVAGSEDFVRSALEKAGRPDLLRRTLTVEGVVEAVARHEGVAVAELTGPRRLRSLSRVRSLCGLIGREAGAIPLARTARYFRRDPSTLSRDVAHLQGVLEADAEERRRYEELLEKLAP